MRQYEPNETSLLRQNKLEQNQLKNFCLDFAPINDDPTNVRKNEQRDAPAAVYPPKNLKDIH